MSADLRSIVEVLEGLNETLRGIVRHGDDRFDLRRATLNRIST